MTDLSKETSNCCGAPPIGNTDLCSRCKEHAEYEDKPVLDFRSLDDFAKTWRAIQ